MSVCLTDSPQGGPVLHTLNKYAERNQGYQWIFPQAYDDMGKVMHCSNTRKWLGYEVQ
jgi:hypothetical protein